MSSVYKVGQRAGAVAFPRGTAPSLFLRETVRSTHNCHRITHHTICSAGCPAAATTTAAVLIGPKYVHVDSFITQNAAFQDGHGDFTFKPAAHSNGVTNARIQLAEHEGLALRTPGILLAYRELHTAD